MVKASVRVVGQIDRTRIEIHHRYEGLDTSLLIDSIAKKVIDAEEEVVKQALIKMGWTEPGKTWTKTSDQLPPDETPVLVIVNGRRCVGELRWDEPGHEDTYQAYRYWDDPQDDGQGWEWGDVTHWQYLPSLPEGVKEYIY